MIKKIKLSFKLYMFDYTKPWKKIFLFEVLFSLFFIFLINFIDIDLFRKAIDISKYLKNVTINNSLDYLVDTFIPAILQILYIYLFLTICSLVYFGIFDIQTPLRKIKILFLDKKIFFSIVLLFLFFLFLYIASVTKIGNIFSYILLVILIGNLFFSLQFQAKYLKKVPFLKWIIPIILIVCTLYVFYTNTEVLNVSTILLLLIKSILYSILVNFYLVLIIIVIWIVIIFAFAEYESAKLGKDMIKRKLQIDLVREFLEKNNLELADVISYKRIDSSNFINNIIIGIFKIKNLDFFSKLKVLYYFSRLDLSTRLPNEKAAYIKFRNISNLHLSLVLLLNTIISMVLIGPLFNNIEAIVIILLIMIFSRLVQRTIEICIAFYNDVLTSKPKGSTLNNASRIKLAVVSILEVTVLSTIFYTLFEIYSKHGYYFGLLDKNYFSYSLNIISLFVKFWFNSFAVSFFNISFEWNGFISIIHLLQLINSIVLITLSIANYLSMKKETHFYSVNFKDENCILYYHNVLNSDELISRLVLSAPNMAELTNRVKELWMDKKINDNQLHEILEFISKKESEIEPFNEMNISELDQYVRSIIKRV